MKLAAACAVLLFALGNAASAAELAARLRYPIAMARLDEQTLVTANERSGTVSIFDLEEERVVSELPVGQKLTDLAVIPGRCVLVTDSASGEVITLQPMGRGKLTESSRLKVSGDAVGIVVRRDGNEAYIVSQWSRTIDFCTVAADGRLTLADTLRLPFCGGRMILVPEGKHLIVAEAFGGRVAVIDVAKRSIVSVRDTQGHNLAALVWDEHQDRLLVAHQILASSLPVTLDNIQWGAVLKNVVRMIPREQLLDPAVNLATQTRAIALGQEGDGSADPSAILPQPDGGFLVTLGGAREMVAVESTGLVVQRIQVGRRPVGILPGVGANETIVLNQFDNSLSFIDLSRGELSQAISLGRTNPLTPAERGEQLFYDARLSFEKWMSCHSCHTHGHTNGLSADTLGDNSFGAPKRTLTLLGTRDTDRWAWNGEVKELHEQVRKSIETSMHGDATADEVYDLTAYLHSLAPPPPLQVKAADVADQKLIERGRKVFATQKCNDCHIGPLTYTSHDVYDVGMPDENKQAKFNPPSLRGVGQASRYFHDGRATALEDVLDVFGHQVREPLTDDDRAALLRFLRSL